MYKINAKLVLELEQKKTGHNDFFKPLLRERLTYVQSCPTEDKVFVN